LWTWQRQEPANPSGSSGNGAIVPIKSKGGKETIADCVVVWTNTYKRKTKVFATTLGHNNDTVADARYLDLVTRGLLWSVDKLDEAHLKPAKKVLLDD